MPAVWDLFVLHFACRTLKQLNGFTSQQYFCLPLWSSGQLIRLQFPMSWVQMHRSAKFQTPPNAVDLL